MAQEWDLGVLAAMEKSKNLQNNTSGVDNTITNVADTFHLTKGGQATSPEQQLVSDQYALMERKRIQALEAQKKKALASLQTEREQVNPAFHTALSNVAGQSDRQARSLAEYLAQRGQTQSGLAAQAEMQRYSDLMGQQGMLEQQRAQAFSDLARRETDIHGAYDEGALQAALERQLGEMSALQQLQERDRSESINTIGQYYQDFAAKIKEIEALEARGDYSQSYLKPYLQMARQSKLGDIAEAEEKQRIAEAKAIQQEFDNWAKQEQLRISLINATRARGGSSGGSATSGLSKDEALGYDYDQVASGNISGEELEKNRAQLIGQYGLSNYNMLVDLAKDAQKNKFNAFLQDKFSNIGQFLR